MCPMIRLSMMCLLGHFHPLYVEVGKPAPKHKDVDQRRDTLSIVVIRRQHRSRPFTCIPRTATVQTDKLLNGDACMHVDCCLGPEEPIASPAPHRISFL